MDIKNILRQHDEVFGLIKQVRTYQNQEQVKEHAEYFALRIPPVRNRIPPVHGNDTTC